MLVEMKVLEKSGPVHSMPLEKWQPPGVSEPSLGLPWGACTGALCSQEQKLLQGHSDWGQGVDLTLTSGILSLLYPWLEQALTHPRRSC